MNVVLNLTIEGEWFDMIARGNYREVKDWLQTETNQKRKD